MKILIYIIVAKGWMVVDHKSLTYCHRVIAIVLEVAPAGIGALRMSDLSTDEVNVHSSEGDPSWITK